MEFRLNLASRVFLDRRAVRRWLLLAVSLLALLLAVNLLYGYRNVQQLRQVDSRIAELEARLARQRGLLVKNFSKERYAEVMADVAAANRIIAADQFRWTALLGRFEELLPDDVAILTLTPDYREHSLKIAAVARDETELSAFLDALLASPDLSQVYLLDQNAEERPDGSYGVRFSLVIREAF